MTNKSINNHFDLQCTKETVTYCCKVCVTSMIMLLTTPYSVSFHDFDYCVIEKAAAVLFVDLGCEQPLHRKQGWCAFQKCDQGLIPAPNMIKKLHWLACASWFSTLLREIFFSSKTNNNLLIYSPSTGFDLLTSQLV